MSFSFGGMKEALRSLKVSFQLMFGRMVFHLSLKGSCGWVLREFMIEWNDGVCEHAREGNRSSSELGDEMGATN